MNEPETRAELIDPQLKASGWGVAEGSKIRLEYDITAGKIEADGRRGKRLKADYLLVYKGIKLAVVEAKRSALDVGEGVAQAKIYAEKLHLDYTFAANGKEIYQICMKTGREGLIKTFPTPDELWQNCFSSVNSWKEKFDAVPFEHFGGTKETRFYQEIAVRSVTDAISEEKQRMLLTLATGTGKTFIAFQIAWKLYQTRWNLKRDASRIPRILFLADRNILANQAFNAFSAFQEDALVRINPKEIGKKGKVPTNGSIFFTIFQTFMTGKDNAPCFGEYQPDFFDFIIVDECHRGGANDESSWRAILEYFAPAVQLGLTATPKREDNADTYQYFGEPLYIYSLKEGINDGFLTPFRVRRFETSIDEYVYSPDDDILEGEAQEGRIYKEADFNKIIEIEEREIKRIELFLADADQNQKAVVFCASQSHALLVRDLINQRKKSSSPNYCVRVTAADGEKGEQLLRQFQDNEKIIPTVLTTSRKLSTGVDARNIRNIVLLRPINSMIEFKQIIGRGTRLFDGKSYFTVYDFVDASRLFADPEWDGEPIEPEPKAEVRQRAAAEKREQDNSGPDDKAMEKKTLKIRLADGKEREINYSSFTLFMNAAGEIISAEEFIRSLFGELPKLFHSEEELRKIWSSPMTRKVLLEKLAEAGYGSAELAEMQKLINAEKSDLFDVLEYVAYAEKPVSREERALQARSKIAVFLNSQQQEFIEFVLAKYAESGVEVLDMEKLPPLLELKYRSIQDALQRLGSIGAVRSSFVEFQGYLYEKAA